MRTYKRNVIELDGGERVEIRYRGTVIHLEAIPDEDTNSIVVTLDHGQRMANLTRDEVLDAGRIMGAELGFTELENGMQEVSAPLSFITFGTSH